MNQKNYTAAIADLELTTQKAIALQPIYWKARMLKGQCHLQKQEYAEAVKEFKLFTARTFTKEDPNYSNRKEAYYNLAQAHVGAKEPSKAIEALEAAQKITEKTEKTLQSNIATLLKELKNKTRETVSAK
jgi:tetratricopeptide (TPR) repeat protein